MGGSINGRRSHARAPAYSVEAVSTPANVTKWTPRHLIYHLWPHGDSGVWQWNVQELLKRINQFDGVRSIGIAVDDSTPQVEEIKAEFQGTRIDNWTVRPNDSVKGEGATFSELMKTLPETGITFYGHGKGVRYPPNHERVAIAKRWADLLYQANLDHPMRVIDQLAQFPMTGACRRFAGFVMPEHYRWHYSGAFFWFRNADLCGLSADFKDDFYCCVEAWPGFRFPPEKVGCLFGDDCGRLYDEAELRRLEQEYEIWKQPKKQATIPIRGTRQPWLGTIMTKPWAHSVTAIIPVLEPDKSLELVIDLLRLQTEKPYILLVDTGSNPETTAWLESLRAPDLEVHLLRLNAVRHSSEPVSMALDAGVSLSRTRFNFFTHSDCFLTRRTAIADLLKLAQRHIVAGHQISQRPYKGWETEFGHTLLMVDQDAISDHGIAWSMRHGMRRVGIEDYGDPEIPQNVVDTERGFNERLKVCGIPGIFTGAENNFQRNTDTWIDHVRSLASSKIYYSEYQSTALTWLESAVADAKQRITEWGRCSE